MQKVSTITLFTAVVKFQIVLSIFQIIYKLAKSLSGKRRCINLMKCFDRNNICTAHIKFIVLHSIMEIFGVA